MKKDPRSPIKIIMIKSYDTLDHYNLCYLSPGHDKFMSKPCPPAWARNEVEDSLVQRMDVRQRLGMRDDWNAVTYQ